MVDDVVKCPKCGHDNVSSSLECSNCGITFEIYRQEKVRATAIKEKPNPLEQTGSTAPSDRLTNCPNCGHPTDLSSADCLKCGIVFSKYFNIQERALEGDPDKLKALLGQKDEHEKAAELRQTAEAAEKSDRRNKLRIERETAAALNKLRSEQALLAQAQQQQAQLQREQALKKQQDEFAQQQAGVLKQTARDTHQALDRQKAILEESAVKALAQAQQDMQAALEAQQDTIAQQQAAERELAEKEKQQALARQEAALEKAAAQEKQKKEAEIRAALERQKEDFDNNRHNQEVLDIMASLPERTNLRERLGAYEGQTVGINHEDPSVVDPVVLIRTAEDHFCVLAPGTGRLHCFPYSAIAATAEGIIGSPVGDVKQGRTVYLVVKLFHPGA